MNYAAFWQRLVAVILDGFIIGVVNSLLGGILGALSGNSSQSISYLIGIILGIGYYVFYQASAGQTLGKKALGIKVVNEKGKTPSQMTFFLREVIGKFVSAIILFIGYLMMLWDGRKQTLHDKIAGTFVVRV